MGCGGARRPKKVRRARLLSEDAPVCLKNERLRRAIPPQFGRKLPVVELGPRNGHEAVIAATLELRRA
jgi:hypothetical protein